jgi:hypothetical protein
MIGVFRGVTPSRFEKVGAESFIPNASTRAFLMNILITWKNGFPRAWVA